tara:strand:- start:627 stop:1082 length:456 start_codon:yes stop_codon:yes gene_type:complete
MNDDINNAMLLQQVREELLKRGIDLRTEHRYRVIVSYRAMVCVIFRDEYNMKLEAIGDEIHKHHATIINSYKKGSDLLQMKYRDTEKIYQDVKSIVSYCEVMLGISSDIIATVAEEIFGFAQTRIAEEGLSKRSLSILMVRLMKKINNRIA